MFGNAGMSPSGPSRDLPLVQKGGGLRPRFLCACLATGLRRLRAGRRSLFMVVPCSRRLSPVGR
jgi:hypothetical protein